MSNPLFQQFGTMPINNDMGQFISEVRRMQQTVKNPRQEVERLLQSGQLSQADFNRYTQIANQISQML